MVKGEKPFRNSTSPFLLQSRPLNPKARQAGRAIHSSPCRSNRGLADLLRRRGERARLRARASTETQRRHRYRRIVRSPRPAPQADRGRPRSTSLGAAKDRPRWDGRATRHAERVLTELAALANDGMVLRPDDITHALSALRQSPETPIKELLATAATIITRKRFVVPKTPTQKVLYRGHRDADIVIGIGPAGTGNAYLAVAIAVSELLKKEVSRIILGRPAVEAGEELGFLPGRSLCQSESLSPPAVRCAVRHDGHGTGGARGSTEATLLIFPPQVHARPHVERVVALACSMRAEKAEAEREWRWHSCNWWCPFGRWSRRGISPPPGSAARQRGPGLIEVREILSDVEGIAFVYFDERDVVRHKLVQDIIKAYDQHQNFAAGVPAPKRARRDGDRRRGPEPKQPKQPKQAAPSESDRSRLRGASRINRMLKQSASTTEG